MSEYFPQDHPDRNQERYLRPPTQETKRELVGLAGQLKGRDITSPAGITYFTDYDPNGIKPFLPHDRPDEIAKIFLDDSNVGRHGIQFSNYTVRRVGSLEENVDPFVVEKDLHTSNFPFYRHTDVPPSREGRKIERRLYGDRWRHHKELAKAKDKMQTDPLAVSEGELRDLIEQLTLANQWTDRDK